MERIPVTLPGVCSEPGLLQFLLDMIYLHRTPIRWAIEHIKTFILLRRIFLEEHRKRFSFDIRKKSVISNKREVFQENKILKKNFRRFQKYFLRACWWVKIFCKRLLIRCLSPFFRLIKVLTGLRCLSNTCLIFLTNKLIGSKFPTQVLFMLGKVTVSHSDFGSIW